MTRQIEEQDGSAISDLVLHQECARCGRQYPADTHSFVCETCGGPLLLVYDTDAQRQRVSKQALAGRPASMWRYREWLPLGKKAAPVTLGEGWTPLVPASRLGGAIGLPHLLVKDEGCNPTGSFKARGASLCASLLPSLRVRHVGLATSGNNGVAWSSYCARAGIAITVVVHAATPEAVVKDCHLRGADVVVVEGDDGDAIRMLSDACRRYGWFNGSYGPYRLEAKKTIGLEVAEQLGWDTPDVVIYPAGPGIGLLGLWKSLRELEALGWLRQGTMPALVAAQSAHSPVYAEALDSGSTECERHPWAQGIAPGIIIDKPHVDFLVLRALRETGGTAVAVDDGAILNVMRRAAQAEGLACAPEGAASLAAAIQLREIGYLTGRERVLCVNTATGLRYQHVMEGGGRRLPATAEL